MAEMDLFFVAMCKGGEVLYVEKGPYGLWERAQDELDLLTPEDGRCYRAVVQVTLPCEIVPTWKGSQ